MVFSFQLQFQVIVCNLCSFKRGAEEGSDCWLCRNRMFQCLISCLSRLAFFVSVFSRHSRVALLFPHLSRRCHNRSQKTHFTISAEIKCSRSGKLSIPPWKSDSLGMPVVSGSGVLRGVSAFRFLALTLVLGEACLADNRGNAVETNTQTHSHRSDWEKEPQGELSAVRCQWKASLSGCPTFLDKQKRKRVPLASWWHSGDASAWEGMIEIDRRHFLLGRRSNSHLPLPLFWADFASHVFPFPPRPAPSTSALPSASVPAKPLSDHSDQTAADRMGSCTRALPHGGWKVHALYCIFSFLSGSILGTNKQH